MFSDYINRVIVIITANDGTAYSLYIMKSIKSRMISEAEIQIFAITIIITHSDLVVYYAVMCFVQLSSMSKLSCIHSNINQHTFFHSYKFMGWNIGVRFIVIIMACHI